MQLHFMKQFPWGDKTHFVEKIWTGFAINDFLWYNYGAWSTEPYKEKWPYNYDWFSSFLKQSKPKITTIRIDAKNRWESGVNIHFEQWTDKPYKSKCYHFAPIIPCMSTQKIEIIHAKINSIPIIAIDERHITNTDDIRLIANNDGFDTVFDFYRFFDKDFSGKIIHWTSLKY